MGRIKISVLSERSWLEPNRPLLGCAPMDGVSDAPFRYITAKYGRPDVIFTEFVPARGIVAGSERVLDDLIIDQIEKPVIGQLFGADPAAFYTASIVLASLGVAGVDINMGCPAKNITHIGAGASLIKQPELAKEIIAQVRKAITDWGLGIVDLEDLALPKPMVQAIKSMGNYDASRRMLTVSVKTRIGFEETDLDWMNLLARSEIDLVSIHGRTLKQQYQGLANWDAIEQCSKAIKRVNPNIAVFGNGDLHSRAQALEHSDSRRLDGVLIGRSAWGNPWVFNDQDTSTKEIIQIALEHAKKIFEIFPDHRSIRVRKHLASYIKSIPNAREIRTELMRVEQLSEIEDLLGRLISIYS